MKHPRKGSAGAGKSRWFALSRAGRCAAALFVLALLVRLVPLGHYVTPDEPIWVLRSVRLLDAVTAGDWAAVPQTGHPGFTTMVIGALGVQLTTWLQPAAALEHLAFIRDIAWLAPESSSAFPHLAFFLTSCRVLVALVCSAGIAGIYALGKRRLGERTARLLALCLALDPFFAGHAGLLHTDALQATFVILAVLFLLPQGRPTAHTHCHRRRCILSGVCRIDQNTGLAHRAGLGPGDAPVGQRVILAKGPAGRDAGAMSFLFMFILFPPFWSNPSAALQQSDRSGDLSPGRRAAGCVFRRTDAC